MDRTLLLCDLLMGVAYADDQLADEEKTAVREQIADLFGGELPPDVEARLKAFHPKRFDLKTAAAPFRDDPEDERRQILVLAAAITEADDEINFAEDRYLRALADALGLPPSATADLTIEVESEPEEIFERVRKRPPPPPRKKS